MSPAWIIPKAQQRALPCASPIKIALVIAIDEVAFRCSDILVNRKAYGDRGSDRTTPE